MKKLLVLTVLGCVLLSGCTDSADIGIIGGADGPTSIIVSNGEQSDKWGIKMYAEDVSDDELTLVFNQSGGEAQGELQTGEWYSLEKNVSGEWQAVDKRVLNEVWNSIAYAIPKEKTTRFEVEWEWLYGELMPGHYRIAKEVMDFRGGGDFEEEIYYAEFDVRED